MCNMLQLEKLAPDIMFNLFPYFFFLLFFHIELHRLIRKNSETKLLILKSGFDWLEMIELFKY